MFAQPYVSVFASGNVLQRQANNHLEVQRWNRMKMRNSHAYQQGGEYICHQLELTHCGGFDASRIEKMKILITFQKKNNLLSGRRIAHNNYHLH